MSHPPKKNLNPRQHRLRPRSSGVCTIVEELQFGFGIELGVEEGKKPDVASQWLLQSVRFANPPQLKEIQEGVT